MREIQQVIMDQLVIGIIEQLTGVDDVIRIFMAECVGYQRRISPRNIPHPHPHPPILLDDGIAAHRDPSRDPLLPRDFDALT